MKVSSDEQGKALVTWGDGSQDLFKDADADTVVATCADYNNLDECFTNHPDLPRKSISSLRPNRNDTPRSNTLSNGRSGGDTAKSIKSAIRANVKGLLVDMVNLYKNQKTRLGKMQAAINTLSEQGCNPENMDQINNYVVKHLDDFNEDLNKYSTNTPAKVEPVRNMITNTFKNYCNEGTAPDPSELDKVSEAMQFTPVRTPAGSNSNTGANAGAAAQQAEEDRLAAAAAAAAGLGPETGVAEGGGRRNLRRKSRKMNRNAKRKSRRMNRKANRRTRRR